MDREERIAKLKEALETGDLPNGLDEARATRILERLENGGFSHRFS